MKNPTYILSPQWKILLLFSLSPLSLSSGLCLITMTITKASPPCNPPHHDKPLTPLLTFLEKLQKTALTTYGPFNFDPKYFVDLSLKFDLQSTNRAFQNLPQSKNGSVSEPDFERFVETYLGKPGADLIYENPVDYVGEPDGFLEGVCEPEVRAWALEIHALWRNLSGRVSGDVLNRPELHTLIALPEPVIVPGSRFREVYYWDSYWVVRGLLASKMYDTAKSIVINLISLIDEYGFVLNGARAYYTNRSQPPLLSSMIHDIYDRTNDINLVKKSLPALLKEHRFWTSGLHEVTVWDDENSNHSLSRYYAMWSKPRPESSTIDIESASKLSNEGEKKQFYRELASTAESGWDFSTRWMRDSSDLTTLSTTSILPVDLNAFVLKMELDIAFLAKITGEKNIADCFLEYAEARKNAINSVFWNEEKGHWFDYWLSSSSTCNDGERWDACRQNVNDFASNFVPIWIESFHSDDSLVRKVLASLRDSPLLCAAGISTSNTISGEQWDSPNGWAPLQHMIIEGLAQSKSSEARTMAFDLAVRWIRTNYAAYKKTGTMHEKYDVTECGKTGGGGEYVPQTGFGWSNGVILALLEEFGWPHDLKIDC